MSVIDSIKKAEENANLHKVEATKLGKQIVDEAVLKANAEADKMYESALNSVAELEAKYRDNTNKLVSEVNAKLEEQLKSLSDAASLKTNVAVDIVKRRVMN